jgi:hypothetical protein
MHTHAPAVQVAVDGHALPHVPQLLGSVCVSTQPPPHTIGVPVGHMHVPPLQVAPAAHA